RAVEARAADLAAREDVRRARPRRRPEERLLVAEREEARLHEAARRDRDPARRPRLAHRDAALLERRAAQRREPAAIVDDEATVGPGAAPDHREAVAADAHAHAPAVRDAQVARPARVADPQPRARAERGRGRLEERACTRDEAARGAVRGPEAHDRP